MHDENNSHSTSCPSCTWPLITVLAALLIVNLVQLVSILQERTGVNQMAGNAQQAITRYQLVSTKLENIAKDLIKLSANNNEAKEIVTQFNIQMNQPNAAAGQAPAKK
ncbi:MAG: hypothetical protein EBU36_01945 [Verrucomicrobia bacterium]|jgi:hypothetical protein|nr:hypothetical protein [Verrucomicrobiota bacterium]